MDTLVYTFGTFFLAFFIHAAVWRISLPHRQTEVLLKIFFGVMAVSGCFYACFFKNVFFGIPAFDNLVGFLRFFILYAGLAFAYIISYSAMEADSPSLAIVRRVDQAGGAGLPAAKLKQEFNDNLLVIPRINDLVRDGLVFVSEGKYKLTLKGRRFVGIFIFFRCCLNAPKGG